MRCAAVRRGGGGGKVLSSGPATGEDTVCAKARDTASGTPLESKSAASAVSVRSLDLIIHLLYPIRQTALHYDYGRSRIRPAGLAARQGAFAYRARSPGERSIRASAAQISRSVRRRRHPGRRFSFG